MDYVCALLNNNGSLGYKTATTNYESVGATTNSQFETNFTGNHSIHFNADDLLHDEDQWNYQHVAQRILVPLLCSCGILGNILTFVVLIKRMNESIEVIEKGSLIGIIALAVCDFMFCLFTLFSTYYSDDSMIFKETKLIIIFHVIRTLLSECLDQDKYLDNGCHGDIPSLCCCSSY